MRIAGLMPVCVDLEKSMLAEALDDMRLVCDEVIVLHDCRGVPTKIWGDVTEEIRIERGNSTWSDFSNRLVLLARAAKYNCDWVIWQDDDERLGPTLTRDRVRDICGTASLGGYPTVEARVRTAWSNTQWRCDGIFKAQRKQLFQLNPFMSDKIEFARSPQEMLHAFPTLKGPILPVDDYIVHYGMRTPSLRAKNVQKYESADPNQKFSPIPYNYLLDESGMKLASLIDPPRFLLVMPTRGRRWSAMEAIASVKRTATHPDFVDIVVCQDEDDEDRFAVAATGIEGWTQPRMRFIAWMNAAIHHSDLSKYDFVGWLADDLRYQTQGWDEKVAAHKELVVYGQDGIHNERMATHPWIRTEIPRALSSLLPPELVHGCADTFIEALAREIGSIAYDPTIRTEHLHVDAGKAGDDQTYKDAREHWPKDKETFESVVRPKIPDVAETVNRYVANRR